MLFANRACTILYNYLLSNSANYGYWLLPLNSCPIVPITFLTAGTPFKLVDIESETLCMDRDLVFENIEDPACLGLLFIYNYGIEQSFNDFFESVKEKREDITIIEDKCLCPPSFGNNDKSPYSELCLYSTGYAKYVDIGFGGFATDNGKISYQKHSTGFDQSVEDQVVQEYKKCLRDKEVFERPKASWIDDRPFFMDKETYISKVQAEKQKATARKELLNAVYKDNIPSTVWLKAEDQLVDVWRFNIMIPFSKKQLIQKIEAQDLFVSSHYQPIDTIFDNEVIGSGKVAYSIFDSIINLFNDKYFSKAQAKQTSSIVKQFVDPKA